MKGKVVWRSGPTAHSSAARAFRFNNVQAAGGVGVLLAGTVTSFDSGIAATTRPSREPS